MTNGSDPPHNLVLAGFMGTGKTTVGQLLAQQLGLAFVDTDTLIEARAGRRIADIFAHEGEAAFRQIEAEVCMQVASARAQVIATGGGALLNPEVRQAFAASGLLICLTANLDTIIERVGHDPTRPLFGGERERLARLLEARADVYDSLPHQVDTTGRSPQQVAEEIRRLWQSNNR
ncbi:MAG: shikimate kinase [Chloroflexi bacterium]|nr:shikimate kinase [Chloroflexota bacterium]